MKASSAKILLDPFCFKQFEKVAGSNFIDMEKLEFADRVNEFYVT